MKLRTALLSCSLLTVAAPAIAQHAGHERGHSAPAPSAYDGQQDWEIKALSAEEQRGWAEGQGMGLAKAAELNGYRGPMHVLELADRLQLTDSQLAATRALMERHKAQARARGVQLVQAERELDALFREKRVNDEDVSLRSEAIGKLQGQIRASHLRTHLAQRQILTAAQVDRYNALRGYR